VDNHAIPQSEAIDFEHLADPFLGVSEFFMALPGDCPCHNGMSIALSNACKLLVVGEMCGGFPSLLCNRKNNPTVM